MYLRIYIHSNDKLRRQLMMDRVGALARSLGRTNHGIKQLKTNEETPISDMMEIMGYALGYVCCSVLQCVASDAV